MPKRTNDFQRLIAMVMGLLDEAQVEESREFDDPHTGTPREVDVYVLIRGRKGLQELTIAVECVDHKRKMDVTWVEKMYGKHSVLKAADVVLLVSSSGFTSTAKIKAEAFGYRAITPLISESKLADAVLARPRLGVQVGSIQFLDIWFTTQEHPDDAAGVSVDTRDGWHYQRHDGSNLVDGHIFNREAIMREFGMEHFQPTGVSNRAAEGLATVIVPEPKHNGEPLYVCVQSARHGQERLARVETVAGRIRFTRTDFADHTLTHEVDFEGAQIYTGAGQVGDSRSRFVLGPTASGIKGSLAFNYTVPNFPATHES